MERENNIIKKKSKKKPKNNKQTHKFIRGEEEANHRGEKQRTIYKGFRSLFSEKVWRRSAIKEEYFIIRNEKIRRI